MDLLSGLRYAKEILLEYESSGRTIVLESGINVLTDCLEAPLAQPDGTEPDTDEYSELQYWLGKSLFSCCGFLFAPYYVPLSTVERAISCFASATGSFSGSDDCFDFEKSIASLSSRNSDSDHSSKAWACEALVLLGLALAYRYSHPDFIEIDLEPNDLNEFEYPESLRQSFTAINAVLGHMPEHNANIQTLTHSAHAFILWTEYNDTQDPNTLDAAIDAAEDACCFNSDQLHFALANLAYLLYIRAEASEELDTRDIDQSIENYSRALCLLQPSHLGRFDITVCLVEALRSRGQVSNQLSDVDRRIELLKGLPNVVDEQDLPRKTALEEYLAVAYHRRYELTTDLDDLNGAIIHYKRTVESPFASNMARYFLAQALWFHCTRGNGTEQDIQNGLDNAEIALDIFDLGPELENRSSFIRVYGSYLSETYLASPRVDYIDRLIVLFESSIRCQNLTAEDTDYAMLIGQLMDHLVTKARNSHEDTIFDNTLNRLRLIATNPINVGLVQADAHAHIGGLYRHKHLCALESKAEHHLISSLYHDALEACNLGMGLLTIKTTPECNLFLSLCDTIIVVHENHLEYNNNSLEALNGILCTSGRALEVAENLGRNAYLGRAFKHWEYLQKRSWATKSLSDLDEQVGFADTVTQLPWLEQTPDRHRFYDVAAKSHMARFYRTGRQFDIDSAINLELHAVHLMSDEKEHHLREYVTDLAAYLTTRFRVQWHDSDIRQAQELLRTKSTEPDDDLTRGMTLSNLGSTSALAFLQYHDKNDYDLALRSFREAIRLISASDHSDPLLKSTALSNLGGLLVHDANNATALQEAVDVSRQACTLSPESAAAHYNLVTALDGLYDLSSDENYLLGAIAATLQAQPIFNADYRAITVKTRLGELYGKLYGLHHRHDDLEKSIDIFRQVAGNDQEEPNNRFDASKSWAELSDAHNHPSTFEAYSIAIGLLPELLLHAADIMSRFRMVTTRFRGLSSKATQCALNTGRLTQAVEMIEYGRSIFWQKTLELHLPLDDLLEKSPDLGTELRHVMQSLYEMSLSTRYPESFTTAKTLWSLEQHRRDVKTLSDRRVHLIEKVRQLPGFENFARPMQFEQLKQAAQRGTIVMLHSSEECCSAIILQDTPECPLIDVVDLPDVTPTTLQTLSSELYRLLTLDGRTAREFHAPSQDSDEHPARHLKLKRVERKPTEVIIKGYLTTLWETIALPVLRAAKLEPCSEPAHRLWWIPTGPFALLPLHAAGDYSSNEGGCLSDYVVPSYALNLSSLLLPQGECSGVNQTPSVLSVWQSEGQGFMPALPMTRVESEKLSSIMNARNIPVKSLGDHQATISEVVAAMKEANIVHFACHGKHDAINPLESAVMLVDGGLTVEELMKHHSDGPSFAFLSACTTAQNVSKAPDEPLHMASAFNFGGFKSVVATSWAIDDMDGPVIAEAVYEAMTVNSGSVDVSRAAFGLQDGIRRLRDIEKAPLTRWVPFIHMGI